MIELTIVVPTYNEAENVEELVCRVERCLAGTEWEIVFVDDDSPDGTPEIVRSLAHRHPRVRCIQRIGRRGLASACLEGILSSSAPYVAVMDADLQHDETLLPSMLAVLKSEPLDIVVASRYVDGGSVAEWGRWRTWLSRLATAVSRAALHAELRDPMSGYFIMRHDVAVRCIRGGASGIGFKVLLDLFASAVMPLRFKELPFCFRPRFAGETKLDAAVAWEYLMMLIDKLVGRWVPVRFVAFSLVGSVGVFVHFAVLGLLFRLAEWSFAVSQASATIVAVSSNFLLNNIFTYRDLRLRGRSLLGGWVSFALACSIGAVANVGIAEFLFERKTYWVTSALAGIFVGAVWNYAVTSTYTWRAVRRGI